MQILVDENIPYAPESFGRLGTVRAVPGRRIAASDVKDVDVLIVRSVTQVNDALLTGSPVKFVGTATIGCDHVDVSYLHAQGIAFASAPGSNANSVAEYITAGLLLSAARRNASLEGATMAVVGVGNVGARVVEKAQALGMRCVLNDPPRQREERGGTLFVELDEALSQADYVTLHVPLQRDGPDATIGMAGRSLFEKVRPGTVFLNTSRGDVVDEQALSDALDSGRVSHAILDVFQREPDINSQLVRRAFVATPHIAGYSFDGKVAATMMLFTALCQWLNRPADLDLSGLLPPPPVPRIDLTGEKPSRSLFDQELLRDTVSAVYDIEEDDRALRAAFAAPTPIGGAQFDLLRKTYRRRREFHHTTVVLGQERGTLAGKVARLGFRVETP